MARRDTARTQTATQRPDVCQTCGGGRVPVIYGKPTPDAWDAAAAGVVVLAGRMKMDNFEHWACSSGHRWPVENEEEWYQAVRAALWGRPYCPKCAGPSVELVYPGDPNLDAHTYDLEHGYAVMANTDPAPGQPWADRVCQRCYHTWNA